MGMSVKSSATCAALYVQRGGAYYGIDGVDPWDEERDARLYAGPHLVVAHPPCARWGRYWSGGPSARVRRTLGDDDGCFAAALAAVRCWGGVLEHPEGSHAWRAFGLNTPPRAGGWISADWIGGWISADWIGGWTCCVDQGHYGHPASKATWLYAVGVDLIDLSWGRAPKRLELPGDDVALRARLIKTGVCQRLSKRQRAATPGEFRDILLGMARSAWA